MGRKYAKKYAQTPLWMASLTQKIACFVCCCRYYCGSCCLSHLLKTRLPLSALLAVDA